MLLLAIALAATLTTNITDIVHALQRSVTGAAFRVRGTVAFSQVPHSREFMLADNSASVKMLVPCGYDTQLAPGDIVSATGLTRLHENGFVVACCHQLEIRGHTTPPTPSNATIREVKQGICDHKLIRLCGHVNETFRDEIDPRWCYLILGDSGNCLYVTLNVSNDKDMSAALALVDAEVEITGMCGPEDFGSRRLLGRSIQVSVFGRVRVLRPPPENPFAVPLADDSRRLNPEENAAQGRYRIIGWTIAAWSGNRFLAKDSGGGLHQIRLTDGYPPPVGSHIEAAGLLETDLYQKNLSNALWRFSPSPTPTPSSDILSISPRDLITNDLGEQAVGVRFNGKTVRVHGIVQDLPVRAGDYERFSIRGDGATIQVDVSANRNVLQSLENGCDAEVTGVCVMEIENWRSYTSFPHVTGLTVVPRNPSDIRILARPSWWTPRRLATFIGALFAALLGILIWNRILQRLVEQRSRQLFKEQIAHTASELRIEERTRLAVELHDAISQSISSAALQINAAERLSGVDRDKELNHLAIAAKTLLSCREELRNCIWDLRSQTLDEPDIGKAIGRMLRAALGEINFTVRFDVPRQKLSDNTVYAILKIIRELAANAIRHGKARSVKIDGTLDGGRIVFSVTDDGTGFDPDDCPGIADGHFGLQGIRERVRLLEGSLDIVSATGSGTCVTVTLNAPTPKDETRTSHE